MSAPRLPTYSAVSLFSNCGAGDVGYRTAGFRFDVMAELDPRRLDVALLNHPGATGVAGDLRKTWRKVVKAYLKRSGGRRPALLCACPPCQGMSSARADRGKEGDADAGSKDDRNLLVVVIAKVAKELKPKLIVVENVPQFLTRKVRDPKSRKPISAADLLIRALKRQYDAYPIVTELADYGVPQRRKRAFITFVRKDLKGLRMLRKANRAPHPRPTHAVDYSGAAQVTLSQALRDFNLPALDAVSPEKAGSIVGDGLHAVPVWDERIYEMVSAIPANSGASAWQNDTCLECGTTDIERKVATCPACGSELPRPTIKARNGRVRLIKGFHSSYRRMRPNEPAATITTATGHVGSDTTIHPAQNRVLSPLECALLQTFPKTFSWGDALKKWGHTNVRNMIGEAVPPLYTAQHGRILLDVLRATGWSSAPILAIDRRCEAASAIVGAPKRIGPSGKRACPPSRSGKSQAA